MVNILIVFCKTVLRLLLHKGKKHLQFVYFLFLYTITNPRYPGIYLTQTFYCTLNTDPELYLFPESSRRFYRISFFSKKYLCIKLNLCLCVGGGVLFHTRANGRSNFHKTCVTYDLLKHPLNQLCQLFAFHFIYFI